MKNHMEKMDKGMVIYGLGGVFRKFESEICWEDVAGVCDRKIEEAQAVAKAHKVKCIEVEQLQYIKDYIVLFVKKDFFITYEYLVHQCRVSKECLIPYTVYIGENQYDVDVVAEYYRSTGGMSTLVCDKNNGLDSLFHQKTELGISDTECFGLYGSFSDKCTLFSTKHRGMDEIEKEEYANYWIMSDYALFLDSIELHSLCFKSIILSFKSSEEGFRLWRKFENSLQNKFEVETIVTIKGMTLIVHPISKEESKIGIYVVCDRPYNPMDMGMYIPICVGEYTDPRYLSEKIGENINACNRLVNELSAFYWVWKNSTEEVVGINHYRRYFYTKSDIKAPKILCTHDVIEYLKQFDIIISKARNDWGDKVGRHLKSTVQPEAYKEGINAVFEELKRAQPSYVDAFHKVMQGYYFFPCNMVIMPKKMFDDYCEWIFSFIREASEKVDVSSFDPYSKRIMAFIAERMLTVWLLRQNLRIKELPYYVIE